MKRSEALKLIAYELWDLEGASERILSELEKAGMKPPIVYVEDGDGLSGEEMWEEDLDPGLTIYKEKKSVEYE